MFPMKRLIVAASAATLAFTVSLSAAEARTLHYSTPAPPTERPTNQALRWWADEVKSRSNGELEIEIHWLQSLSRYADAPQAVSSGLADIAPMNPEYAEARLPLWSLSQTEIGSGDNYIASEAWRRVVAEHEEMHEELRKNTMVHMMSYSSGPRVNVSTTRPYLTPDEFRGDRVRLTPRAVRTSQRAGWRVTPVTVSFADIYSALDRGTISGAQTYLYLVPPYKHHEVSDYLVETGIGQSMIVINMNLDTWESLTEEQQAMFRTLNEEFMLRMTEAGIQEANNARELLTNDTDYPTEMHVLTDEQRASWEEHYLPVEREYAEGLARRNSHAVTVFEAFQQRLSEVEAEVAEQGYPWERD